MESRILHACSGLNPEVPRDSLGQPEERALPAAKESEDEASTISGNYKSSPGLAEVFRPDWSQGVHCDMCKRGPSLSLGAWYFWCCGKPVRGCECTNEEKEYKKEMLAKKTVKGLKGNSPPHIWSGRVHKLCALWTPEVYQNSEEPWILMELEAAIRRSRRIKCSDPDCGLFGATLGCRVRSCKKSFHYPCADRLSAFMKVCMWDGFVKPITCKDHRYEEVKEKKRKRDGSGSPRSGERALGGTHTAQIASSDEEGSLHGPTVTDTPISGPSPQPMGTNLLTNDFSYGCEAAVRVPCTNDVDDEPPPYVEYITKSRHSSTLNCLQPPLERLAKACKGCTQHDLDDPSAPLSIHIPFERREDDYRLDWIEERMHGRLPYDKFGRLVIGANFNELVECNERCECGKLCSNREMQKGLRTPLELYKTKTKDWAVRTLVPIPRGKFVIEYVGEIMTQEQAQKYGHENHHNESNQSCLQELDYPGSKRMPDFILDAFHASNVARFINYSCNPNLKMYRVYVETTYKWFSHIALYSMRDIEAGEELTYNYNYVRHNDD